MVQGFGFSMKIRGFTAPAAGQRIGASVVKREEGALGGTSGGREGVGGVIEGVRLTCGPMRRWLG
jgi:hypothetical protein